jgi:hypothetical protein
VPGLSSAASYLSAMQRQPGLPFIEKILYALVNISELNISYQRRAVEKIIFTGRNNLKTWI